MFMMLMVITQGCAWVFICKQKCILKGVAPLPDLERGLFMLAISGGREADATYLLLRVPFKMDYCLMTQICNVLTNCQYGISVHRTYSALLNQSHLGFSIHLLIPTVLLHLHQQMQPMITARVCFVKYQRRASNETDYSGLIKRETQKQMTFLISISTKERKKLAWRL